MKEVHIGKAHGFEDAPIEGVTITIGREVDTTAYDTGGWEEIQRRVYDVQAKELEEALHSVLPGGTYNRLLAKMLERSAGLLRIPLGG